MPLHYGSALWVLSSLLPSSVITLSPCTQARLKGVAGGLDELKDIVRRVGRLEKAAEGTFLVLKAEYAAK